MTKLFKLFGSAALLAGMLMVVGCGSSSSSSEQGQVVKGPVTDAVVTYSDKTTTKTGTDGKYNYNGLAVTTAGGTYTDMNGVTRSAPPLATPAGKRNATPLTTLFANASAEDQAKLTALLGGQSIDTVVTGTIGTGTSELIAKLNETIGEVLTQNGGTTVNASFAKAFATEIGKLTSTNALVATNLVAAYKAAATAAGVTYSDAIATAMTTIADKTKAGATVPTTGPTTGSTGGTGSTGTAVK